MASIETSALHLDVLRDFKRISSHLTSVAYPILDRAGVLSASRLRPSPAAPARPHDNRAKAGTDEEQALWTGVAGKPRSVP